MRDGRVRSVPSDKVPAMDLRGRTVVLYGEFTSLGKKEAARRLEALGAHAVDTFTDDADAVFLAHGERGPIPRTEAMLRLPEFSEDALLGMLEAGGSSEHVADASPFIADYATDTDPELRATLEQADWSAFVAERDLPPLRARLDALESRSGVTDIHRLATERLYEAGHAFLLDPHGHDAEISAHALSPDGRYLATGSWVPEGDFDAGGVLQIWDVAAGRAVNIIRAVYGGVGWPGYSRTLQWSADGSRLGVAYGTNTVGVWPVIADEYGEPDAVINVSDGNSRPSPFAFHPDGRSAYYHSTTNGSGGLQGCIVPLIRGWLFWLPNHVTTDHPYLIARQLPPGLDELIRKSEVAEDVGEWVENPVWSPDGTRLFGTNAVSIDAATRTVAWYRPATLAALSADGRRAAVVDAHGLSVLDAADGRADGRPHAVAEPCALRWAPGRPDRLAVLTRRTPDAGPAVHIFDAGGHRGTTPIAHPEWTDHERWTGDRNAWAWAPDGDRAAVLTTGGTVELWSFADPEHPRKLDVFAVQDATAVHWGANDTLVLVGDRRLHFRHAETGTTVGDFTFLATPEADLRTWSVGCHHTWPTHWSPSRLHPDRGGADGPS